MVGPAGVAILSDSSDILRHSPEDRHLGAALERFASAALVYWYVARVFLSRD